MPPPSLIDEIIENPLENIGIPGMRNSWDSRILEILDIPLGLLGVLRGAGAATIDNSQDH